MAFQIEAILMTLSDLHSRSSMASLFKWGFCTIVQQFTRFQNTALST